ncbi:MAG: PAS domain-containing protein, partial [Silanimonas sp.]
MPASASPSTLAILALLLAMGVALLALWRARRREARERERFALIARATSDGIYDADLERNTLWRSEAFCRMFGLPADAAAHEIADWLAKVHPEDRERVRQGYAQALNTGMVEWEIAYRFDKPDGSTGHARDRLMILRDAAGHPVRAIGGVTDISEELGAIDRLALLKRALDATTTGVAIVDARQDGWPTVYVNAALEAMSGYSAAELLGRNLNFLQGAEREQPGLETLRHSLREG